MTSEERYWWRVTNQIWIVLLIGYINQNPIRSTTQLWVVTRHQYGISALISQTSFRGDTSGDVVKCRLFSQATSYLTKRKNDCSRFPLQHRNQECSGELKQPQQQLRRKCHLKVQVNSRYSNFIVLKESILSHLSNFGEFFWGRILKNCI